MMLSPRWKLGCTLAAVLCMLMLMSCVLVRSAIQQRTVAPLEINIAVGPLRLMAYVTNRPNCPPYGGRKPPVAAICAASDSIFSSAQAYTIWISIPAGTSPSGISRMTFRRLLLLPIE